MRNPDTISKKPPENPSFNFKRLRKEGIELIQNLSGNSWTDYNLHDPGVTTLEVLCYALTELGYKANLLKEAYEADKEVSSDFIGDYFFSREEMLSPLPLSKWDFEHFIEKKHDKVLSAWFEDYPLLYPEGMIRGGYEIALMLEYDEQFGNLNTDVIRISLGEEGAVLEVNFFDEENRRMPWETIREVTSCTWNEEDPDSFFVFEDFNCQVSLMLEVYYLRRKQSEMVRSKARITLNQPGDERDKNLTIEAYQKETIKKLESREFLDAIDRAITKEHFKGRLLHDIQQTLLPCRNLCEDFVTLRVVHEQEVKIDVEITLDDYAPSANFMVEKVYDRLDAFLMQSLRRSKQPEHRSEKNLLYASNFIEEIVKIEGVEAAKIRNLNLFIDGIPTIPLNEEAAFECIHLQRFSYYVPKLSREKSSVSFIRSGVVEEAEASTAVREFTPQQFFPGKGISAGETMARPKKKEPETLGTNFFEALKRYTSIRNDFPRNYRLSEGEFTESTPENVRIRVKQFKHYLAFFERILIDYLNRLHNFNDLLSVKQASVSRENELDLFKDELPDLELLTSALPHDRHNFLSRQNKILDHLLARFSVRYTPVTAEEPGAEALERKVNDKISLLKDIPVVTRERGLGLPVNSGVEEIWDSRLLSGFQKSVYRKLGIPNEDFRHLQLTKAKGQEPAGFYLIEHILLARRKEDHVFITRFNRDADVLFEYIRDLLDKEPPFDPYSFQLTIVLPDWHPSWRVRKNRIESLIREELPAHVLPHFLWLGNEELSEFEILYEDWLQSLLRLQTMRPL